MGRSYRNPGVNIGTGVSGDMPYTMSNVGSLGTGAFKQLSGYEFQLYKLASANSLLTIGLESGDYVKFTLNQASIDHNQLTNYDAAKHFLQSAITQVGTIATGVWNGTTMAVANGGTGTTNGSIAGAGALLFSAGGAGQSVTLTPTTVGRIVLAGTTHFNTISAHGSPTAGDVYSDGENLYFYDGVSGTWVDVTASAVGTATITLVKQASGTYALPTAVGKTNQIYSIQKTGVSGTDLIVNPSGSQTINNALTKALFRQYQQLSVVSDGANWTMLSDTGVKIDVTEFGAVGDGVTDNYTAIQAAIDSAVAGDTVYFPKGKYVTTHTLHIANRINICGDGQYSMIGMSGNEDLIHYDGTLGTTIERVFIRDLYFVSTSTTAMTALLKIQNAHDINISDCYFSGSYINLYLLGVLRSTFYNLQSETTGIDGFLTQSQAVYGVYMTRSGGISSNGNRFFNCSFRQLSLDYAVYIVETNNEGGFSWWGGTFEGIMNYAFYVSGVAQPFLIEGIHLESNDSNIYISGSSNGTIISAFGSVGVQVVNSYNIVFQGCLLEDLDVDADSSGRLIGCRQGQVAWTIDSPNFYGGAAMEWSGQNNMAGGRDNSMKNLCPGNLESWSLGLPVGFTKRETPTITQCGTALGDTTKLFGSYCAKITWGTGAFQGLEFPIPDDIMDSFVAEAVCIRNSEYAWQASATVGEFYLTTSGGANPSITLPSTVIINGTPRATGTIGSLAENTWNYGSLVADGLAYNTIYVKIVGGTDPDGQAVGYVQYVDYFSYITAAAYFKSPATNKAGARIWVYNTNYGGADTGYDMGIHGTFTLPSDSWKKCICTFKVKPYTTSLSIGFGLYGESAGDYIYVDGIEVMTGFNVSDRFNDNTW